MKTKKLFIKGKKLRVDCPRGAEVLSLIEKGIPITEKVTFTFAAKAKAAFVLLCLGEPDKKNVFARMTEVIDENGACLHAEIIKEAIRSGYKAKITGSPEKDIISVEVDVEVVEARTLVSSSTELDAEKDRIVNAGICPMAELEDRIKVMGSLRIPESVILMVLKKYRKFAKPVTRPSTIYVDPDPKSEFPIALDCIMHLLMNKAVIYEGDKSVGKNVCTETLAWCMGLPLYLVTFNRQTTMDEIFGTKTTLPPQISEVSSDELQQLAMDNLKVQTCEDCTPDEILNASRFEALRASAGSIQIVQEISQIVEWARDGGLLVLNEINMMDANTASFLNPITDNTGFIDVSGIGRIYLNPDAHIVGNQNRGYTGTQQQNAATMSRFGCIKFPYPKSIRNVLKSAVKVKVDDVYFEKADAFYGSLIGYVHRNSVSNNCLNIRGFVAALTAVGMFPGIITLAHALEINVINGIEPEEDQATLRQVLKDKVGE